MTKKAKATQNDPGVEKFLSSIKDEQRQADCRAVLEVMMGITGESPIMWGKDKVGLGKFHYRGKTSEGDWFHVGFSSRKQDLALYLHCELDKQGTLLEGLGKHRIGKSCLYIKRLEDVHMPTLKKLIKKAYQSPAIAGATIDKAK